MPQLSSHTDGTVTTNRRPLFTPDGHRIWLCFQRKHTFLERILALLTSPLLAWRVGRLMFTGTWNRTPYYPDPTVIVPTGRLAFDELVDSRPDGMDDAEAQERIKRERTLAVNRAAWKAEAPTSRSERLAQIDLKPKYTVDGRRIFLYQQREATAWEEALSYISLPWGFAVACLGFSRAIKNAKGAGEGGDWNISAMDDPTWIVPTGPSYWAEGELVQAKELSDEARETRGRGAKPHEAEKP
ncbi:hypothetical protein IAU60_001851 [Kwoniella sp. DSM 27419]